MISQSPYIFFPTPDESQGEAFLYVTLHTGGYITVYNGHQYKNYNIA